MRCATMDTSQLTVAKLVLAFVAVGLYGVYWLVVRILRPSALFDLPGPPAPGLFSAHFETILNAESVEEHERLRAQYGHVARYYAILGRPLLVTTDLKAISTVLTRTDVYEKPRSARFELGRILGNGVFVSEGAVHRNQRRVLNPAFGPAQIRDLTDIFLDKANELREVFTRQLGDADVATVDALQLFSNATLDIIGLAGFRYDFASLSRPPEDPSELSRVFLEMLKNLGFSTFAALQVMLPVLRFVPTPRNRSIRRSRNEMDRIGKMLLTEIKTAQAMGEKSEVARDLLSLLVRANAAESASQRLSDDEVLAHIPTFLLAGHETTSTGSAWAMYALAQRPDIQARLRDELRAFPLPTAPVGNSPLNPEALAALDKLPLLDAVVRESLRLYAPLPTTIRTATVDSVLPLATPYLDRHGVSHAELRVSKNDPIIIPILLLNRSKELWGPDAHEWNPDRHLVEVPEALRAVPGVWGHMLSFISGPRSCIGYRFALIEMKLLLFTLFATFRFELELPADRVGTKTGIIHRPIALDHPEQGSQLRVRVRRWD